MLYSLARRALFALDAETAHELTIDALARAPALATLPFRLAAAGSADPVELLGLRFRNRVGLAAGLDKNGACIEAWDALGFGFIEIGTVTPRPQPGNPRPRLFRLPQQQALINRLGFNNLGVDALLENVRRAPRPTAVLGINIGKNADTPVDRAAADYEVCLCKVYGVAGYVTVNISSPNTKNLRDLQDGQRLVELLRCLRRARSELAQQHGRDVPMLVKVAPDLSAEALAALAQTARGEGVDGLIVSNTTVQRPALDGDPLAAETGGLSGAPLKPLAEAALRAVRTAVGADYPLIGVGGIGSGDDAVQRRRAGADLVQIYTGLIYRGPGLVGECARALRRAQALR